MESISWARPKQTQCQCKSFVLVMISSYAPSTSVLKRSKLQCSPSRATMKITISNVLISFGSIWLVAGRLIFCCKRAISKSVCQFIWDRCSDVPLHDFSRLTKRPKSFVRCSTTTHIHLTASCKIWTPPFPEGLMIMGCKASCKSCPNLAAVIGICGIETRKIFNK